MAGEWRYTTLGDLIDIKHGFAFEGRFIHEEPRGDVLLTPGNFALRGGFKGDKFKYHEGPISEEFVLRKGDLLVTMTDLSKQSDTLGYPALVPTCPEGKRFLHNQRLGKISLREPTKTDVKYIYYVLCGSEYRHEVLASVTGTTVRHTSPDRIKQFRFLLPPLPEQRAIANILGTLDDKIELNRRMNETLESMARALFKDWFVDFGPTRAKIEGRDPYLAPETWDLFPDKLDEDGKPEGWTAVGVGEVVELLDSKRIPLSSREREKRRGLFPYHGATGVMDYVNDFLFDEILLLVGEDGSVARPNGRPFTQYVWGKIWVNNHAHVLRGVGVSVEQLKCFFDRVDIGPYVTGAVQPKLNQANLKRVQFPKASPKLHQSLDGIIQPWFARIRLNDDEAKILAQTRDLLLPKLMSGEVRVGDVDKFVQEST